MLGKIFHISLVTMVAIIKERKKKMIEIMETFEKIEEEKESIFHGIDGRGMEMGEEWKWEIIWRLLQGK